MQIYQALNLDIKGEILSFVGGGGKTTTIFQLAKELKRLNKRILITTTTAIYNPKEEEYDYYFLGDIYSAFAPVLPSVTIVGKNVKGGKLIGLSLSKMEEIIDRKIFDFILIEADGANRRPIKAPANHEPVVAESTTKTIGLIGLDCLDQKIVDIVHRPEIFTRLIDKNLLDKVDEQSVAKLVLKEKGLFKGARGKKVLLLNKAYEEKMYQRARRIRDILINNEFKGDVLIADVRNKKIY